MKGRNVVQVGGTRLKLPELSVLVRRLTPEEIMLHTRKSSRKRKADCLKTSQNKYQSKLQKKFRRIWVVSDNSDEESDCNHGTSESSDSTNDRCYTKELTQSPSRCSEARHPVSKEFKDCKSCHDEGNSVLVTACSKHHVKKSAVNPLDKNPNLFEPDGISLASHKSSERVIGSKTKSISSDSERLKGGSRETVDKVTDQASFEKHHETGLMSNVKPACGSMNSKVGIKSNGPSVANSINLQQRHSSSTVECQSNKIHPKNDSGHKSSLHIKDANPKKSLNKHQRDLDLGTNQMPDLKNTNVAETLRSPHGASIQENCRTPVRAVENTPPLFEKGESKEITRNIQSSVLNESHSSKSSEKPLRELISLSTPDHGLKGKIVRKDFKTKEGHLIGSNKHCASPIRLEKNSPVLSEKVCPKEKVTGYSDIMSKKIHSVISKEKIQSEPLSIPGKELDLKGKLIRKSVKGGDGHLIASDKRKQCASPVSLPQGSPVSIERLGQKDIGTGKGGVLLKEIHSASSKEKSHSQSTSVPIKELDINGKCLGKNIKKKVSHLLASDKNKKCASPVRPVVSSPISSERCVPKNTVTNKNGHFSSETDATPTKEKPQNTRDHHAKGSSNEKTMLSKDGIDASELSEKLACAGAAGENLLGPTEMLPSGLFSKEIIPTSCKEKLPSDSFSRTNASSDVLDLNVKCVGKSFEARNSGSVAEASKQCPLSVRTVENGTLSTEKLGSGVSKESPPAKSTDQSQKELVSVTNQERKLKKRHVSQSMKSKDHVVCEMSKQFASPGQLTDNMPLSHASPGRKETLASNHDLVSKETHSMKSTEKQLRNLASLTGSETDLRKKSVVQNEKCKDDRSAENFKQITSSAVAVDIQPGTTLRDNMINDAMLKETSIHPNSELKLSHPSVEKSQHVSKVSVASTVSSSPQGKPPPEVVSTKAHHGAKEVCRREKDKSKAAVGSGEKSQQSSKIDNGSRRLSKEIKLSVERNVPIGTIDPVSEGRLAGPEVKSNEIDVTKKSQQNSKLTKESFKSCETKGKEVEFLRSSLIEKSGGSSNMREKNSSAIEADNIDQLMAEYETLTSYETSKTSGEKKTERKLKKKKILNIFGEEHLMEDSESMMMSPVQSAPVNISAIGLLESSMSIYDGDPSLQISEISASVATASLNTSIIKRKTCDEGREGVAKKRKLSGAGNRKRDGKSRRHSLEVSSVKSTPEKKAVERSSTSLDCPDSWIANSIPRDSSSGRRSLETTSPVRDSDASHSIIISESVITPSVDHCGGEGHQPSRQSKPGNRAAEVWIRKIIKRETDEGSEADRHSFTSVLCETSGLGEETAGGDEDPDVTIVDINFPLKKESPQNSEENESALNPESNSSDQLGQILVSSPRSLAVDAAPSVDSRRDCMESEEGEPRIAHQAEADSAIDMEVQGDGDDLLCPDAKKLKESVMERELLLVAQEVKRKKAEMKQAEAKQERILRAWEKWNGIEVIKREVQKKEHGDDSNHSCAPDVEESLLSNAVDLKEEFDRASSVSTEILGSTDDFQDLQQQGDSSSEAGNTRDTDLSSRPVTPVEDCLNSQENVVTSTLAHGEGHTVVSVSALEKSAVIPTNSGSETQLGTREGSLADSGSAHILGEQEALRPTFETSVTTETTVIQGQSSGNRGDNGLGGRETRKEDRIRVRGLRDLLAVPSTEQSDTQDNLVGATTGETANDPDKDIRDSFKGEKAYQSFKNLQNVLADVCITYLKFAESRNKPNHEARRKELLDLYQKHAGYICRLCSDIIFNFRYSEPRCFAGFLFFQVSFSMQSKGVNVKNLTIERLKELVCDIFIYFSKFWNSETQISLATYLNKVLQRMGMTDTELPLTNTPTNSEVSPLLSSGSNVVLSQTSLQSVTVNKVVVHNPSTQTSSTECQVLSVPLVPSHQNLPGNAISIRNQQVPCHLVSTNSGFQTGQIQGRPDVSSTSVSNRISGQPEVNCGPTTFHIDSTPGLRSVPNVCVNPNQQQQSSIPFVPVHAHPLGTHANVSHLFGGELLNANQNRVVGGQLRHNSISAGQLNPNCSNVLAGQTTNSVQNLMAFTQTFNITNQVANTQFTGPVHNPTSAPNILQTQLRNQMCVPFGTQQTSTTTNHQNNITLGAQASRLGRNHVQRRRPSHSGQVIHNQDSMLSQTLQGDPPSYYHVPGSGVASSAHPVHVQRPLVQATPLHSSQSAYHSHPSNMNTNYPPPPPYQGRPHVISQGQLQRSDNVVSTSSQNNHCPPLSYFSSASHNGGITGSHSGRQGPVRMSSMPVVPNAGQATAVQHSGTEGMGRNRPSADDVLRWRQRQQQQVLQTQSCMNIPINQVSGHTVVNHSVVSSGSVSRVPSHPIYSNRSDIQQPQLGHPVEARPSIIQSSPQQSMEAPAGHALTVSNTASQQLSSMGIPIQSTESYETPLHSGQSMGVGQQGSGASPGTYAEQMVTASRHQALLPSIASPGHRNSPGSAADENDQAGTETHNNGELETQSRGQGLGRPISNDSGYRSPSQGCENSGNNGSLASVCYSCGQEALLTCSKCQSVYYCGGVCQAKDWGRHKNDCRVPVPGFVNNGL